MINSTQSFGLVVSISAMIMNFAGKKGKGGHGHGHGGGHANKSDKDISSEETKPMLLESENHNEGDIELGKKH